MMIKAEENTSTKLLALCYNQKRTVGELAELLGIAPSSVVFLIKKLEKQDMISVDKKGKGKKTFIRTKQGVKVNKFVIEILKAIKEKGSVSFEEYAMLPGFVPNPIQDPEASDKLNANSFVLYSTPSLVKRKVELTEAGKKFLEENK